MYGSIIISHGLVTQITSSFSTKTNRHTCRIEISFPQAHFSSDRDFFYSYDMTILDRFSVDDKVYIFAKRSINKGSFVSFISTDIELFNDFVEKNLLNKYIRNAYSSKISDIYLDENGLDVVG